MIAFGSTLDLLKKQTNKQTNKKQQQQQQPGCLL